MGDYYQALLDKFVDDMYLISRGVRSVCMHTIEYYSEDEYKTKDKIKPLMRQIRKHAKHWKLYVYPSHTHNSEGYFTTIFVYKYPHQKQIIKFAEDTFIIQEIKEWMIGKLLGYSDESIEEFINYI